MSDTNVKPSSRIAESGRPSRHASTYEFFVPSLISRPLKQRSRPLDALEGKYKCSASFSSSVSFKELINQVWPVVAVSLNLRSVRGRKVTESLSSAVMVSMTSELFSWERKAHLWDVADKVKSKGDEY